MRINTNLGALAAANNLGRVNDAVRSSAEKLSSGFRINKASDDAAGLGVANLFRSDVRALTQAQRNAEQANSVYQIAEGGASSIQKILERMKELAAQAASDSVDSAGRTRIDSEYQGLLTEITRVTNSTQFQGTALLNGGYGATMGKTATTLDTVTLKSTGVSQSVTFATDGTAVSATNGSVTQTAAFTATGLINFSALGVTAQTAGSATGAFNGTKMTVGASSGTFLVGASRGAGTDYTGTATANVITIDGASLDLRQSALKVNLTSTTGLAEAQTALSAVDSALAIVNTTLGTIGAGQNRLANAIENVKSTILNYQAAESTIRDLDMAAEMVSYSKNQILAQAGQAMLQSTSNSAAGVGRMLQNLQ